MLREISGRENERHLGIFSVMFCWMSNGEGPWGGGGRRKHYKPSVVGGRGRVRLRNKNVAWGGHQKKCPAPPPQLINNDRPLKNNRVSPQHFSFHNTMLCLGR